MCLSLTTALALAAAPDVRDHFQVVVEPGSDHFKDVELAMSPMPCSMVQGTNKYGDQIRIFDKPLKGTQCRCGTSTRHPELNEDCLDGDSGCEDMTSVGGESRCIVSCSEIRGYTTSDTSEVLWNFDEALKEECVCGMGAAFSRVCPKGYTQCHSASPSRCRQAELRLPFARRDEITKEEKKNVEKASISPQSAAMGSKLEADIYFQTQTELIKGDIIRIGALMTLAPPSHEPTFEVLPDTRTAVVSGGNINDKEFKEEVKDGLLILTYIGTDKVPKNTIINVHLTSIQIPRAQDNFLIAIWTKTHTVDTIEFTVTRKFTVTIEREK